MSYGAIVKVEEAIYGLLHVSDTSWLRKVGHASEVVQKGDKLKCVVLDVDPERKRVALGLKQMASDPWEGDMPSRYHPSDVKTRKVTKKRTNFGGFIELEPGLEGLHVSELADRKVGSPEEVVKAGDEIQVSVLCVDVGERSWPSAASKPVGPGRGPGSGGRVRCTRGSPARARIARRDRRRHGPVSQTARARARGGGGVGSCRPPVGRPILDRLALGEGVPARAPS
jgi:predicted RNA-binding protein with RPS1 domain